MCSYSALPFPVHIAMILLWCFVSGRLKLEAKYSALPEFLGASNYSVFPCCLLELDYVRIGGSQQQGICALVWFQSFSLCIFRLASSHPVAALHDCN